MNDFISANLPRNGLWSTCAGLYLIAGRQFSKQMSTGRKATFSSRERVPDLVSLAAIRNDTVTRPYSARL